MPMCWIAGDFGACVLEINHDCHDRISSAATGYRRPACSCVVASRECLSTSDQSIPYRLRARKLQCR